MTRDAAHRVVTRLRDASGATMIEAAIITPLLLLLTFSIIDFGALFYVDLALENGVSQASRYSITGNLMDDPNNPGTPLSREDSIMLAMRQATPNLTINDSAFTFSHMAPNGSAWTAGASGAPGELTKVTVDYDWDIMTPVMRPFFPNGLIHFTVDSAMKDEPKFN